jgi:hypothetical protein
VASTQPLTLQSVFAEEVHSEMWRGNFNHFSSGSALWPLGQIQICPADWEPLLPMLCQAYLQPRSHSKPLDV